MNTISLFKILSFVWAIWPTVSKVVPTALEAIKDVSDKSISGAEKKSSVVAVVRAVVPADTVPDALLNWIIETILQITRRKEK